MPPPSPEESGTGSREAESTRIAPEGETAAKPQSKKYKRGRRAPQSTPNHRKANRREDREESERGAPSDGGWGDRAEEP